MNTFPPAQVYRAFAVALALNRTLVLPRLRCYCYKNWFMTEQCKIPGDLKTAFPFNCTLEQYLRPKVLYRAFELAGSQFTFREWSFIHNPRSDDDFLNSKKIVKFYPSNGPLPTPLQSAVLHNSSNLALVQLPSKPTFEQLKELSVGLKDIRRLHFPVLENAFGGFHDVQLRQQYEAWLHSITTHWCCRLDREAAQRNQPLKQKLTMNF